MERNEIVERLKSIYYEILFKDNFADIETGSISKYKKFATYPAVGDNYGKDKKILIVGLDIGSDETHGKYQTIEERTESIQSVHGDMNHHMGGTYFTALYLLQHKNNYADFLEKVKDSTIFKTIIKRNINDLPKENPLSFIAFTNFYKFVTIMRESKLGDQDRNIIDRNRELELFKEEIGILNPDIIFFQSTVFYGIINNQEMQKLIKNKEVYIGYHPSKVMKGLKYPSKYFTEFVKKI